MSLLLQIKIIVIIVLFLLPIIPVYLFFPQAEMWNSSKIDIEDTLSIGFVFSICFNFTIILIVFLIIVFPLLAIIIIGIIGVIIKNEFSEYYEQAIYNYNKFHTNKDN